MAYCRLGDGTAKVKCSNIDWDMTVSFCADSKTEQKQKKFTKNIWTTILEPDNTSKNLLESYTVLSFKHVNRNNELAKRCLPAML